MPNYRKMYFQMAAKMAKAVDLLTEAMREGEEAYSEEEPVIRMVENKRNAPPPESGGAR